MIVKGLPSARGILAGMLRVAIGLVDMVGGFTRFFEIVETGWVGGSESRLFVKGL